MGSGLQRWLRLLMVQCYHASDFPIIAPLSRETLQTHYLVAYPTICIPHDVAPSERLIARCYDAIRNGTGWEKTLFTLRNRSCIVLIVGMPNDEISGILGLFS